MEGDSKKMEPDTERRTNMTLYTEDILDLYKYPSNKKITEHADITYKDENPSCGDDITIYLQIDKKKSIVQNITWTGKGCAISQASAEIISQTYKGKKINAIKNITTQDIKKMLNTESLGPVRIKCAMLAPAAIKKGIVKWEQIQRGNNNG